MAEIPCEGHKGDQGQTPTDPFRPDLDLVRRLGILLERILAGEVVRRPRQRGGEESLPLFHLRRARIVAHILSSLFIDSISAAT